VPAELTKVQAALVLNQLREATKVTLSIMYELDGEPLYNTHDIKAMLEQLVEEFGKVDLSGYDEKEDDSEQNLAEDRRSQGGEQLLEAVVVTPDGPRRDPGLVDDSGIGY
jgi:hypothetical protein